MKNIEFNILLADIQTLTSKLAMFENKYDVLTEVFHEWYEAGNEPENDAWVIDFTEWAGLYQSRRLLISEYHNLVIQTHSIQPSPHAINNELPANQ